MTAAREFRTKLELEAEVERWRNAHKSVVIAKRQLSAKYGAIMARKPSARWRRLKKRIKHWKTRRKTS